MEDSERGEAEYLLYEVIRQHQRLGQDLTKTDFHKRSFLTKKLLEDNGIDVTLPVYWYEHGIMVDLDDLLVDFLQFKDQRYESRRGTKAVLDADIINSYFDLADEKKELIKESASQIAHEFKNIFDTSVAKDETYERFADNEFIIHLNDLRYHLENLETEDRVPREEYAPTDVSFSDIVDIGESTRGEEIDEELRNTVLSYLDDMTGTYPEKKYNRMYPQFLEWESLTRQFAYNDMFSELENFTSKFWNTFSRVELRIHHNEDIPKFKIHRWKRERREHIDKFEQEISNKQQVLLRNRTPTSELESISEAYSDSVDEAVRDFRAEQ